jgi:REP element-mobilizing transposase RayT
MEYDLSGRQTKFAWPDLYASYEYNAITVTRAITPNCFHPPTMISVSHGSLPRLILPGIPHHVTQRGNRREQTFFEEGDYALYIDLLAEAAARAHVEIWGYCLMPNHVHIIATPQNEDGLSRAFRHVHRHYTGYINARQLDRASVAGPLLLCRDGRAAFRDRAAVCLAQPDASAHRAAA